MLASNWRLSSFAVDGYGDIGNNICVQRNADTAIAYRFEVAVRQAHLRFVHFKALFVQLFGNVMVGDGTKQATINTSFLRQLDREACQFFANALGLNQLLSGQLFQLSTARFEFGFSRFSCTLSAA